MITKDFLKVQEKTMEDIIKKYNLEMEKYCAEYIKELLMSGDLTLHTQPSQNKAGMCYIPYQGQGALKRKIEHLEQKVAVLKTYVGQEAWEILFNDK